MQQQQQYSWGLPQNGYAPDGQYPPQQGQGAQYYVPQGQQQQQYPPPQQQPQYAMPQNQPYAPQQPMSNGYSGPKPEYQQPPRDDKFAPPKPKWNDLPFLALFWVQLAGFIVVAVISLRALSQDSVTGALGSSDTGNTLDLSTAYLFALIAAAGFVFAILYLVFVRSFTRFIFEFTLILSVIISIGYAIYLWTQKYWSGQSSSCCLAFVADSADRECP